MSVILQVNHLSKQFNHLKAVDDLSFTVNEGDVYGFLGQNGAGKSTTIRMMLTLIAPSAGSIDILGKNVYEHRNEVLRQVGAVIERPDLYKYLSAYDNLAIFAKLSGLKVSKQLIMDQLEKVGLHTRAQSKVKTYSQGMKQRLGIAIALVHDPKLIILDEPTNGLDPQGIADMRNLIISLSKDLGKTVIVSSHLLSEIEQMANRMIIIHKGKKITEGDVKQMMDPAKTIVDIATIDDAHSLGLIQTSIYADLLQVNDGGIRMQMDKNNIPAMIHWMSQAGIQILSVQPRHSLEDYFLSLTNPANYVESASN
jgi:ABC-type multidrug transport system ATPase subunit